MTPLNHRQTPHRPFGSFGIFLAAATLCTSIQAQTYNMTAFETGGISDPDVLTPININATLSQNGTSLDVTISNDSTPGDGWITSTVPTVTKIGFDVDGVGLPTPTFANNPPNIIFNADNSVNIPGSNNISFNTTYGFKADPPPTTTGIDPGETFVVTFANTTVAQAVKAIHDGDMRIAVHVQQIGKNDQSASFVTVVPEPTSAMLVGLAGLLSLVRRRR